MIGYNVKTNGDVNTTNALRHLDSNEVITSRISDKGKAPKLISESGLYKLVLRSDKPQAKPFQDWVTKVVLPAIRKDGGYIAGEENTDDDDLLMARALQVAQRKIESIPCKSISYKLPRSLGQTHETVRFKLSITTHLWRKKLPDSGYNG